MTFQRSSDGLPTPSNGISIRFRRPSNGVPTVFQRGSEKIPLRNPSGCFPLCARARGVAASLSLRASPAKENRHG